MHHKKHMMALGGGVLMGLAGVVHADATVSNSSGLEAEVSALKSRLAELEARQSDTWMNERRAEEVKALVRDVLADADTRASLLQNGLTAGHNGNNFFLASEDGSFLLNISGQIQVRYTYNHRDEGEESESPGLDESSSRIAEDESGFSLRRTKLFFSGHIGSPRIGYSIGLQMNDDTQNIFLDHAYVDYELMDGVTIWGGERKAPFMREEFTSSAYQLTAERSLLNELFTAGRVQGVGLIAEVTDWLKGHVAITDGMNSGEGEGHANAIYGVAPILVDNDGNIVDDSEDAEYSIEDLLVGTGGKDFHNDDVDFAVTARVDVKLMGQWDQMKDFTSWSDEDTAVFVGGAIHYEVANNDPGSLTFGDGMTLATVPVDNILAWTVDASIEHMGWNLYGAYVGRSVETGVGNFQDYGFMGQVGYNINDKWEPFARYEWFDLEGAGSSQGNVSLLTVGMNWYLAKHTAKFTVDGIWAFDELNSENLGSGVNVLPGLGLLADGSDSGDQQFAVRAQFQLLF